MKKSKFTMARRAENVPSDKEKQVCDGTSIWKFLIKWKGTGIDAYRNCCVLELSAVTQWDSSTHLLVRDVFVFYITIAFHAKILYIDLSVDTKGAQDAFFEIQKGMSLP
ncbi:MAG: hypothetical protein LKG40_08145 [Lachnospiraceae bacterium]|jgi:hypothetical protein|nr:hypothetical protein [Lachnospiraceae bacterium]MCI1328985.1 hypothetical protein [Lachnospiraceae bacterium]